MAIVVLLDGFGGDSAPRGISEYFVGTDAFLVIRLCLELVLAPVAGVGLLKRREWGRIVGIVVALLVLFRGPTGIIVGAYALTVLARFRFEVGTAASVDSPQVA